MPDEIIQQPLTAPACSHRLLVCATASPMLRGISGSQKKRLYLVIHSHEVSLPWRVMPQAPCCAASPAAKRSG